MKHNNLLALQATAKQEHDTFDVVLYGSAVRGEEANDIDIAIILADKQPMKEKLERIQRFRAAHPELPLQVNVVTLRDLEDPGFLARQGILAEGLSLRTGKPLAERFGFIAKTRFAYTLKGKTASKRRLINYALVQRRGDGLLKTYNAERLAPGIILTPLQHTSIFMTFFEHHKLPYTSTTILEPAY